MYFIPPIRAVFFELQPARWIAVPSLNLDRRDGAAALLGMFAESASFSILEGTCGMKMPSWRHDVSPRSPYCTIGSPLKKQQPLFSHAIQTLKPSHRHSSFHESAIYSQTQAYDTKPQKDCKKPEKNTCIQIDFLHLQCHLAYSLAPTPPFRKRLGTLDHDHLEGGAGVLDEHLEVSLEPLASLGRVLVCNPNQVCMSAHSPPSHK